MSDFIPFRYSLALMLGIMLTGSPVDAQHTFAQRQYYGNWQRHPTHGYSFRPYYYKPTPTFNGYKHHYVIHHPSRPQHLFFYNPYSKQYWGRCPVSRPDGVGKYSLLAENDRKPSLKEIPESAFPEPTDVPPIPESTDDQPLDLPPDDLPIEATEIPGKE